MDRLFKKPILYLGDIPEKSFSLGGSKVVLSPNVVLLLASLNAKMENLAFLPPSGHSPLPPQPHLASADLSLPN